MTDKEIIIVDGVDVTQFNSDKLVCMNRYDVARLFIGLVENLQRETAECENIKTERDKALDLYKRYEHKFNCPFYFRDTAVCLGRKDEDFNYEFCKKYPQCWVKELVREKRRYNQTLDEIEKYIKDSLSARCRGCTLRGWNGCKSEECLSMELRDILDIISKAKDGNNE